MMICFDENLKEWLWLWGWHEELKESLHRRFSPSTRASFVRVCWKEAGFPRTKALSNLPGGKEQKWHFGKRLNDRDRICSQLIDFWITADVPRRGHPENPHCHHAFRGSRAFQVPSLIQTWTTLTRLISTEGDLRRPMSDDDHPSIQPSAPHL